MKKAKSGIGKQVLSKMLADRKAVLNDSRDMGQQLPITPEQVLGPSKPYGDATDAYS